MAKGGQFERDVCRDLSKWLSNDKHDDLLWRSSQSGGRATMRARKGQRTTGHEADISATSNWGRRLTRFVSIECKNGYKRTCLYDLLDAIIKPSKIRKKSSTTYDFILQATLSAERAMTPWWCVIHRRTRQQVIIYGPVGFFNMLGMNLSEHEGMKVKTKDFGTLVAFRFKDFLKSASAVPFKRRKK